ncbi:hypothetical protein [Micromonospora rubida]
MNAEIVEPQQVDAKPADTDETPNESNVDKTEDAIKLIILVAIMAAALAQSFTHMKGWTMRWAPDNTNDWFGWANAVISELLPIAATLSLRRRLRQGKSLMSYPLFVLLLGAVLSIGAQLAAVGADASMSAKFLACLPALAFLLLSKMVLGDLDAGRKQKLSEAEEAERRRAEAEAWEKRIRAARAEAEVVDRKRAEAEANLRAEAEARTRAEAEVKSETEARQAAEAEVEAVNRKFTDERKRNQDARQEAEVKFRADTAQIVREAEAEVARFRTQLDEVKSSARDARQQAAEASEQAAGLAGQLTEAQAAADRAAVARVAAEQHIAALTEAHANQGAELERVNGLNARLLRKVEATSGSTSTSGSGSGRRRTSGSVGEANRKQLTSGSGSGSGSGSTSGSRTAPVAVPDTNPNLDGFLPETVAKILDAYRANPEAKQKEVADATGISTKTIGAVMRAVAEYMQSAPVQVEPEPEAEVEPAEAEPAPV